MRVVLKEMMDKTIAISPRTISFTILFLLLLWFLYLIKYVLILLFLAFIIASALHPLSDWLEKKGLPTTLSAILVFFFIVLILSALIALIFIPFSTQFENLAQRINSFFTTINVSQLPFISPDLINQEVRNIFEQLAEVLISFFENVFILVTTIVITVYYLIERKKIYTYLKDHKRTQVASNIFRITEEKLGYWVRGQLAASLIVGVLYYAALKLLGIDFAMPIAVLGAIFEIIPIIGPILASIPAIIIGFTVSPLTGLLVLAAFLIIQQLESHVIYPLLMKQSVGLNPLLVILAVTIGSQLLGIPGALLAVPFTVVLQTIFTEQNLLRNVLNTNSKKRHHH